MTNYEKYQKEIIEIFKSGHSIALINNKPVSCGCTPCINCELLVKGHDGCRDRLGEWLESEYVEPPVDWSKVPVDAKVLVKIGEEWERRYFAGVEDGRPYTWNNGSTSWTKNRKSVWNKDCIKLYCESLVPKPSETGWIKCSQMLPSVSGEYLVRVKEGYVVISWFNYYNYNGEITKEFTELDVVEWMPIPGGAE